jgi:hypothetical protein
MDLRQILRGWFTPDEDGRRRPLEHASQDFQSGFDGAARNARQSAPVYVLNAMSRSGIPGWQGMARERSAEDSRQLGLEAPGPVPMNDALRIALRDTIAPPADTQGYRPAPAPSFSDSAPEAALENRAFVDARTRAQEALREEGYPTFNDPAYQQSGQALAASIDQNRADVAEMQRRQSIPWALWWQHRGRQDANHETTPEDTNLLTRYRFGPAPRYERAESRRPGPR